MTNNSAVSISEFIFSVKDILETEFRDVQVVGEVSNLSLSSAGHYYFNLSDAKSSVSCAMFKFDATRNPYIKKMKNGDQVILRGPVSVYAVRGTFQIVGKRVLPYGKGDLNAQFEFLKEKLRSRGMFELVHKKEIPTVPKRIAVITALRGAALQDFLNIIKRRSHWCDVLIIPSVVQGNGCAKSIINAINKAETNGSVDIIVITRGGGSIEDLWGFNDENLVQRVFDCGVPIMSAIGHQTDFTLIDYVSDYRAETPSAAAEILTEAQMQLTSKLKLSGQSLRTFIIGFKSDIERKLYRINPSQFQHILHNRINDFKMKLAKCDPKLLERSINVNQYSQLLDDLIFNLKSSITSKFDVQKQQTTLNGKLLNNLNPKSVLGRGYTYLEANGGLILTDVDEFDKIKQNEQIKIHFNNGQRTVQKV
jgi:exodeoxyribonuclease VII large subunit